MESIKFIKLVNDTDIVTEVEETPVGVILKWPMKLSERSDAQEGEPKIRVEPYAAHVKGHCVQVDRSMIVFMGEPVPPLREYYEKNVSSMVPPSLSADSTTPPEIKVTENEDGSLKVD